VSVEKSMLSLRAVFVTIGIAFVVSNAYLVWEGNRLLGLESDIYKQVKVDFTVVKPISRKRLEALSLHGPNHISSPTRSLVQVDHGKTCCPESSTSYSWRKAVEYKFAFLDKLNTQDRNHGLVGPKSERSTKHILHEFERVGRHQALRITIFEGSETRAKLEAFLPLETIGVLNPSFFTFLAINHPFTVKPEPVDISHLTSKIDEFFNLSIVGKQGLLHASNSEPEKVLAVYDPTSTDITRASIASDAALNDPRCSEFITRTEDYNKQRVFKILNDPANTSIRLSYKSSIFCIGSLIIAFEKDSLAGPKALKLLSPKGDLKRQVWIREDQQVGKQFSDLGRLVIDPESFVFQSNKLRWSDLTPEFRTS
jgi:hypothetical protein